VSSERSCLIDPIIQIIERDNGELYCTLTEKVSKTVVGVADGQNNMITLPAPRDKYSIFT